MSKESNTISIVLRQIEENECYRPFLKELTQPIFLVGNSITGQCRILPQKPNEKMKHRGIVVKLIGRYMTPDTVIQEFTVQEQRISPASLIVNEFVAGFTFDKPRISYASYHGIRYGLSYYIVVEIKVSIISKLTKSTTIVFLDPVRVKTPAQPTNIQVSHPPICFDIYTDKAFYAMDDYINGQIVFGKYLQMELQNVTLWFVLIERLRDGSQTKSDETVLFKYELVDGCPRPSATIPFVVQLAPLQLWTLKSNHQSVITTSFRVDVYVRRNEVSSCIAQQSIQIYQRFVEAAKG